MAIESNLIQQTRGWQMRKTILLLLVSLFFLTSCSGVKELTIFKKKVEREKLNLDKPTPLQLEQLRWIIITSENAEEVFKKLEEEGIDPVIFGLTDKDFELLAKNFAQIRAFMIKQGMTLDQYREYYESKESKPTKPE